MKVAVPCRRALELLELLAASHDGATEALTDFGPNAPGSRFFSGA